MLEVYLLKQGAPKAVRLSLPAADYELLDALEKAGITNERDIYSVEVTNSKLDYLPQLYLIVQACMNSIFFPKG